ncbi:T9SS type A sorting domain-containing protein [Hymenobacter sp.]|uniref:T9SS type A sorting domain-containing protein n=1 Tax=Hymenobacter sp. TaxID=1898978 RepID=UPI00286D03AC|nr:T9SS type A sorting domain-containing protein [Hymenobacter sp.]
MNIFNSYLQQAPSARLPRRWNADGAWHAARAGCLAVAVLSGLLPLPLRAQSTPSARRGYVSGAAAYAPSQEQGATAGAAARTAPPVPAGGGGGAEATQTVHQTVKVCAEGTQAYWFVYWIQVTQGSTTTYVNASDISVVIREKGSGGSDDRYGKLVEDANLPTPSAAAGVPSWALKKMWYKNPLDPGVIPESSQYTQLHIDASAPNYPEPEIVTIQVFREPVVFIHGLFGSGEDYVTMANALLDEWPFELTYVASYEATNTKPFVQNANVVGSAITICINNARASGYVVAKVAVVSHSMGCALTRCYIQGSCGASNDFGTRNDINRWIPMNGVNMGTHISKVLLDGRVSLGPVTLLTGKDVFDGAVADLAFDSYAFNGDNNGLNGGALNRNMNKAPVHAIAGNRPASFSNLNESDKFAAAGFIRYLSLTQGKSTTDLILALFDNEANDNAVPFRSQTGGLAPQYYTEFDNLQHGLALKDQRVIDEVRRLLKLSPTASAFSTGGFSKPNPAFRYTLLPECTDPLVTTGGGEGCRAWPYALPSSTPLLQPPFAAPGLKLSKGSGASGSGQQVVSEAVSPGQTLSIPVGGASDIVSTICVARISTASDRSYSFGDGPYGGTAHTYSFAVPSDAVGTILVQAWAKRNDGNYYLREAYFNTVSGTNLSQDINLTNTTIASSNDQPFYAARQSIATSGFTVNNHCYAQLTAGTQIRLSPGTTVQAGGALHVSIQPDLATAPVVTLAPGPSRPASAPAGWATTTQQALAARQAALPAEYGLEQNYPNPFGAVTTIGYVLPQPSTVSLRVCDMFGRVVATLATNEPQAAGQHTATFDAGRLANGIYFYTLRATAAMGAPGSLVQTKRMTVVK